jgi:hypothetical protein
VRTWKYAKNAAIVTAKTACPFDSASAAIKPDVWIACHIGTVLNVAGLIVVNVPTCIASSGVNFAMTQTVMIVVSRITTTETSNVQVVVGCCYHESWTRKKSWVERTRC